MVQQLNLDKLNSGTNLDYPLGDVSFQPQLEHLEPGGATSRAGEDRLVSQPRASAPWCDIEEFTTLQRTASHRLADLTPRQRDVLVLLLKGFANKRIAGHLGLSQRTVECHRAAIMKRTGSKSLPALARLALAAALTEPAYANGAR